MVVLVQANVLTVGLNGKNGLLLELPIRLITVPSGREAIHCLRNERFDSIISNWDLDDMQEGRFIKNLRAVKPDIPTIVFIRANEPAQEIAARSLGVSAVLTDESDDEFFRQTVANVLGIRDVVPVKAISPVEDR